MRSTGYRNGQPFPIDLELIDGYWMSSHVARRWERMRDAAAHVGIVLAVDSAFRTNEQQTEFYTMSDAEKAKRGIGGVVAKPGWSNHQSGDAIDIVTSRDPRVLPWLRAHAGEYGFTSTVPSEPWHFESKS